jgi:hypothetical protein
MRHHATHCAVLVCFAAVWVEGEARRCDAGLLGTPGLDDPDLGSAVFAEGQGTDVPWSSRTFVSSLLLGWGLFNVVEGVIDHHLLGLHHVHPGANQLAWDVGFLVFGALLVAAGWGLIRAGRRDLAPRGAPRPHTAGVSQPVTASP